MDYTTQVKLFYSWLSNQQPHKAAISLWHALMYQSLRQSKTEFVVGIATLEETTGFKRSELYEARNWLIKNKRIKCKIRGGASACLYSITALTVRIADNPADASADTIADGIKQAKPRKKAEPKPPKETALHWKPFTDEFDKWYKEKTGSQYNYLAKDFAHLKSIYQFLQKRASEKKFEFTEDNLLKAFQYFLQKAWEKDDWLQRNFTIPNLLSQFNQIVNATSKSGKQPTGGQVSTGNLFSRINAMPD